jgi:hypothetical protein
MMKLTPKLNVKELRIGLGNKAPQEELENEKMSFLPSPGISPLNLTIQLKTIPA